MTRPEVGSETELMPTPWPDDNGPPAAPRRASHLDRLNTRLTDDLSQVTMEWRLRNWDGDSGWGLVALLRALPYAQFTPIQRRQQVDLMRDVVPGIQRAAEQRGETPDPEAQLKVACDGLIAACADIYLVDKAGVRDTDPMDPDDPSPCRFDTRTCQLLGLGEPATAREAVLMVFGGPDGIEVGRGKFLAEAAWTTYAEFATEGKAAATESLLGEG